MMSGRFLGGCGISAGLALVLAGSAAAADLKASYVARCSMCHQSTAEGLPGQFPRLAGRAAQIAQAPEGRRYLVRTVLWGIYGPIEVDGQAISGVMPGMSGMADADIADVLNHVLTTGKPAKKAAPFKPADIAAVRAEGRGNGGGNAELRKALVTAGVIK